MAVFPTDIPDESVQVDDYLLFSDTSDSGKLKKNIPSEVVKTWLWWTWVNSDLLSQWSTNLYMTSWEKVKLSWIETWAEVNQVNSVNGIQWAVVLTQDEVWDGSSFVRTENNFTNTSVIKLNNATNHITDTNNPHSTTKAQVGLGNVTNDEQLSTTDWNFSNLDEKSDVQQHLDDLYVLQDSADSEKIKKVKNQTDLIWKASLIQDWNPSVNYYVFNFSASTNYVIRSYVYIWWNLYRCLVQHQSSWSFSADLGNGFREQVTGWWMWWWNILTSWNWAPVLSGVNPWDLYVDLNNGDIYYWDWSTWQITSSSWWYTWDVVVFTWTWAPVAPWVTAWDLYSDNTLGSEAIYVWNGTARQNVTVSTSWWVNYASSPTTWDKLTFSVWVWADTIDESGIGYDSATTTLDWSGTTQTWTTIFDNGYTWNYEGSTINYDDATTQNNDWTVNNTVNSVINNNWTDINHIWVNEDYDATSVTNHAWTQTNTWTINNNNTNINNTNVIETYDATSTINNGGTLNIENLIITWSASWGWLSPIWDGFWSNIINFGQSNLTPVSSPDFFFFGNCILNNKFYVSIEDQVAPYPSLWDTIAIRSGTGDLVYNSGSVQRIGLNDFSYPAGWAKPRRFSTLLTDNRIYLVMDDSGAANSEVYFCDLSNDISYIANWTSLFTIPSWSFSTSTVNDSPQIVWVDSNGYICFAPELTDILVWWEVYNILRYDDTWTPQPSINIVVPAPVAGANIRISWVNQVCVSSENVLVALTELNGGLVEQLAVHYAYDDSWAPKTFSTGNVPTFVWPSLWDNILLWNNVYICSSTAPAYNAWSLKQEYRYLTSII